MTFIDPPNTLAPRKKPPAVADTPQEKQGALLMTTATLLAIVLSQMLSGKKLKLLGPMFLPQDTVLNVLAPIHKAFSDPPKIFTPT